MLNESNTYIESLGNKGLRPRTLSHYEFVLTSLNTFLLDYSGAETSDMPVGGITMNMLNAYSAKHRADGLSVNARNNYYTIIRSFFHFLHEARLIDSNPAVTLQHTRADDGAPDDDGDAEAKYTTNDIQTLLDSLNKRAPTRNVVRDRAILALFIASGLRAFEACSLDVSDFAGIRKGVVRCVKKGSDRKSPVIVGAFCVPYIDKYLFLRGKCDPDEPLFISQKRDPKTGKPNRLTPNALWKSFSTKQRKADTRTGLHCFRAASLTAVNSNAGIAAARDFGRHKKADVTAAHYTKSSQEERRQAINNSEVAAIFGKKLIR